MAIRNLLSGTPYEQLRRYTTWSLYLIVAMAPVVTAIVVTRSPRTPITWFFLAAVVGQAVLALVVTRQIVQAELDHEGLDRGWAAAYAVFTVVAAGLALAAARPSDGPGVTTGAALVLTVLLTGTAAFALRIPTVWLLGVAAVVALLTGGARTVTSGHRLGESLASGRWLPATISSYLMAAGLLISFRMSLWMLQLMRQQEEFGAVRSELAVAEERLRFSRDLHDVFGRVLTAVAVKSDLAAEWSAAGQGERAAAEMREVHRIAQESLREVRAVVSGYRSVDLAAELRGAQALLRSAGVRARVIGDPDAVPARAAEALAWVVREGVTNVVRHSDATTATVTVADDGDDVLVTIENDGVLRRRATGREARPGDAGGSGGGLGGLRARLAPLGGRIEHRDADARFVLTARVPKEAP